MPVVISCNSLLLGKMSANISYLTYQKNSTVTILESSIPHPEIATQKVLVIFLHRICFRKRNYPRFNVWLQKDGEAQIVTLIWTIYWRWWQILKIVMVQVILLVKYSTRINILCQSTIMHQIWTGTKKTVRYQM